MKFKYIHLESIDSTNNYAKALDASILPAVVVAESQTAGRGRLGRSFYSPADDGIYMSIAVSSDQIQVQPSLITIASAVAVCTAIESVCNVSPSIKWVNDIFLNNKKVCGILTEQSESKTIIGVGVNCLNQSFPDELSDIASSIFKEFNHLVEGKNSILSLDSVKYGQTNPVSPFEKSALMYSIAENILSLLIDKRIGSNENFDFFNDYKSRCFILGKNITVSSLASSEKISATAVDISPDGALIVKLSNADTSADGKPEYMNLISADVSVTLD